MNLKVKGGTPNLRHDRGFVYWLSQKRRRRRRLAGQQPWTPLDLGSKLGAWWDAQDTASIGLVGGKVSSWTDRKSGFVLAQATDASRPTYNATGLNGKAVIVAPSGAQSLNGTGIGLAAGYEFVIGQTNVQGIGTLVEHGAENTHTEIFYYPGAGATELLITRSATTSAQADISIGAPHIIMATVLPSLAEAWVDGVLMQSVPTAVTISAAPTTDSMGNGAGGGALQGFFADRIHVNSGMTTAERQKVEGFLAWKYGLASLLPANHPYKSRAPLLRDP